MRLLLDTRILRWATGKPERLSERVRGLLENGYVEIAVTGEHAVGVRSLPMVHRDPFGRMLAAHAIEEGPYLVTADERLAGYPISIVLA